MTKNLQINGQKSQSFLPVLRLQRQCACGQHTQGGGECEDCKKKRQANLQRAAVNNAEVDEVPESVHRVLRSPSGQLDAETQQEMGSRFGHDFSGVRVHTDAQASESARAVNALAYTVGRDVVFGAGQYTPRTEAGKSLLAHELTHVVQQKNEYRSGTSLHLDEPTSTAEYEAHANSAAVMEFNSAKRNVQSPSRQLSRFSDPGHHVIEEAGLAGAGFTPEQIRQTERGNIERDYSQVGAVGNTLLLCRPHNFGGYQPEEHFDNFMWDAITKQWRTRGASAISDTGTPVNIGRSPIDYITSELHGLASMGLEDQKDENGNVKKGENGLVHLGNAFHTVEDFFAHSNFVELINNDFSFGRTLLTGSFDSADSTVSLSHTLESVSSPPMDQFYHQQGEQALPSTRPLSHSRIAHDHPSSHNYAQARRLAALVIQDLGVDVLNVMRAPKDERQHLMDEQVLKKINQYLRPPSQEDPWWDQLKTRDAGAIDHRLEEAERRTPATVNQCIFSPLRNIEASRDSNLKIPLGVAVPVNILGNQVFIQAGGGFHTGLPLRPLLPEDTSRNAPPAGLFAGAQITGRF